jgi:hypothetical protein
MNEGICDFRFAICDLMGPFINSRQFTDSSIEPRALSLTPRFSGVYEPREALNRFSGFKRAEQTAEAVQVVGRCIITPLKRGVNERESPITNRKSKI